MRKTIPFLILAVLIILSLSTITFSQTSPAVETSYRGDITEDGKLNIYDILGLLKILGSGPETERQREIANVDKSSDGKITIFDLLALLRELKNKSPEVIYWGPAITGLSSASAAVGDTVTVYVINFDQSTTVDNVTAYINDYEAGIADFSLDSISIVVPDVFTGGDVSLIVANDTTNTSYLGLLFKLSGAVETVSGLDLSSLTVVSPQKEDAVKANGAFEARITDSTEATFVVAKNQSGNPVLLSFMTYLPETGLMGVKTKGGVPQLASVDNLSLGLESTALSLIMLNPVLFQTSATERKDFATKALLHPRFNELVTDITNILASDINSNYLVDDSHPEIFQLANTIADSVYKEILAGNQQALLSGEDEILGIQAGSGNQVEFTNPYHIYYGTGIYNYGQNNLKSCITQKPRPFKWGFIPWSGDLGITKETVTPDTPYSVKVSKGFDFDSPYRFNFYYPEGRATIYNSSRIVIDLLDLVIKIPNSEGKLEMLLSVFEKGFAVEKVIHGFETGDAKEVLAGFIDIIKENSDVILSIIWENSKKESIKEFVEIIQAIAGNAFKILTFTEKIPFYWDLIFAPGDTTFSFVLRNGQIEEVTEVLEITMFSIPGGTFQMGSNWEDDPDNPDRGKGRFTYWQPIHTVILDAFQISETEITNKQYVEFLNQALAQGKITVATYEIEWYGVGWGKKHIATGSTGEYSGEDYIRLTFPPTDYPFQQPSLISFTDHTFSIDAAKENWPVGDVSWFGAKAFALFYGMDLPTEAEWEYAAQGGQQYDFATDDNTIGHEKANYGNQFDHPIDVGTYPANPFGLKSMSGNVSEWCNDWFSSTYYSISPINNPQGPDSSTFLNHRSVRGGNYFFQEYSCRTAERFDLGPTSGSPGVGFRIVRR